MSPIDSSNPRHRTGYEAWSWTHLHVDRRRRSYRRVTADHPPINTITAATLAGLAELVGLCERDPELNVVVFESASPLPIRRVVGPADVATLAGHIMSTMALTGATHNGDRGRQLVG